MIPAITALKVAFCVAILLEPIVGLGRAVLQGKRPAAR